MKHSLLILLALAPHTLVAQVEPSPYKVPEGLVNGASFIDRIEPMPFHEGLETEVWGGDNVKPRDAHNGLEDAKWSYWCNNNHHRPRRQGAHVRLRWLESSPKGHGKWPRSQIVRAVGDSPTGPFKVLQDPSSPLTAGNADSSRRISRRSC
jgi:hypothetical protein